ASLLQDRDPSGRGGIRRTCLRTSGPPGARSDAADRGGWRPGVRRDEADQRTGGLLFRFSSAISGATSFRRTRRTSPHGVEVTGAAPGAKWVTPPLSLIVQCVCCGRNPWRTASMSALPNTAIGSDMFSIEPSILNTLQIHASPSWRNSHLA